MKLVGQRESSSLIGHRLLENLAAASAHEGAVPEFESVRHYEVVEAPEGSEDECNEGKGNVCEDLEIVANKGYDLIVSKGHKRLKIEVKGCSRMWQIPDPYVTEFDSEKRLIADFLCVEYLIDSECPKVCMIPREALGPEHVIPRSGYRIRSGLKKKSVLEKFMEDAKTTEPAKQ